MRWYQRHKKILNVISLIGVGILFVFSLNAAHAQVSIDFPTTFAGFSTQDIKVTIANIVRIVLGFIGVIFVVLLMYGGFVWMTSQGEKDKLNKAKKIIASAVIGLLLVLTSFAIASFVVQSLTTATGNGPTTGPPPPGWPLCDPPSNGIDVKICEVVGSGDKGSAVTIKGYNFLNTFNPPPGGTSQVIIGGAQAEIVNCNLVPQWTDRVITAIVPAGATEGLVQYEVTNSSGISCTATNTCLTHAVNAATNAPSLLCMNPTRGLSDGSVIVTLEGRNFGAAPGHVEMQGNLGRFNVDTTPSNIISWAPDGTQIRFRVPAPGAPEAAITGDVVVIDAATLRSNSKVFTVDCANNAQCASNCCLGASPNGACYNAMYCAVNGPHIDSITPNNGEIHNYITIRGTGFGPTTPPGHLYFKYPQATGVPIQDPFPAACSANWSPTQIIMEVPDVGAANNGPADVWVTVGALTSNIVTFNVNDTVRPGLCSVSPISGYYDTAFNLTGNNFVGTTKYSYFGSPSSHVTSTNQTWPAPPPHVSSGRVPNILPGDTTIGVNIDGQDSNPLQFTVLQQAAGDPVVTSIDPNVGPTGTYVTITGMNFGNLTGKVLFNPTSNPGYCLPPSPNPTPADCLGDLSFPPICGTDFWRSDRVIVKVPQAAPDVIHYLIVVRPDGKTSQTAAVANVNEPFTKNAGAPKPGLCRIDPIGGPAGTLVNYFGERFGNAAGTAWFYSMQQSTPVPSIWNDQQALGAGVPVAAVDGTTTVRSSALVFSNSLPFKVGACKQNAQCGSGNYCCSGICRTYACTGGNYEENNWTFTAGQNPFDLNNKLDCTSTIQSPTPYPYEQIGTYNPATVEQNAPVNSIIAATFSRDLNFSTIAGNVLIYQCATNATWGAGCLGGTDITAQGAFTRVGNNGWQWRFNNSATVFVANTWYEVRMNVPNQARSNIAAGDGSLYRGSAFLGALGTEDSFKWHFRTRDASQKQCEVSNVLLNPSAMDVPLGGISGIMTAAPVNPQCYLCSGDYTYTWTLNPPAPTYVNFSPATPPTSAQARFTGLVITPDRQTPPGAGQQQVTATVNTPTGPVSSVPSGVLSVDSIRPRVVEKKPTTDCDGSICTNVQPFARFNVTLSDASLTRVELHRCSTAACNDTWGPGTFVPTTNAFQNVVNLKDKITITPNANLAPLTWYRVIVRNTVTNLQGQQLTNLDYDADAAVPGLDSVSWFFQTGYGVCDPTSIDVVPNPATISGIGNKLEFSGDALVADNGCGTYSVNPYAYRWSWDSNPTPSVASVSPLSPGPKTTATALLGGVTRVNACLDLNRNGSCDAPPTDLTDFADLTVDDSREPMTFIGHRPDDAPYSPPENFAVNAGTSCQVYNDVGPMPNPNQCQQRCRNVLASAIFSNFIDANSLKPPTAPQPDVAHYSFDSGTARDDLNKHTTGVLQGAVSADGSDPQMSGLGGIMSFDGGQQGANKAYISFPGSTLDLTTNFSIAVWFKGKEIGGARGLVSKVSAPEDFNFNTITRGYALLVNGKRARFVVNNGTVSLWGSRNIMDNLWHYIVATYDGATMSLYVDGIADGTMAYASPADSVGLPLEIGHFGTYQSSSSSHSYLSGWLGDVAIYNHALTPEEVVLTRMTSQGQTPYIPNMYVVASSTGPVAIPGTLTVSNYIDTTGVCTNNNTIPCVSNVDCGGSICSYKRGRVDFSPTSASQVGPPTDVEAYYSFNNAFTSDQSGPPSNGHTGSAFPPSPNDPKPTEVNDVYPTLGIAYAFDGVTRSSGNSQGISIVDPTSGGRPLYAAGTNDITVEAWVKPLSFFANVANPGIVSKPNSWGTLATDNQGKLWATINQNSSPVTIVAPDGSELPSGKWSHVAVVASSADGKIYLYINGRQVQSVSYNGALRANSTDPMFIGQQRTTGIQEVWHGSIDEVRFYRRALSPGEVSNSYFYALGQNSISGIFDSRTPYEMRICWDGSCATRPIMSTDGLPYVDPIRYAFMSGDSICRISTVDIVPNPARFTDVQRICRPSVPNCIDSTTQMAITAHARDAFGTDLSGVRYCWRKTTEFAGPYASDYYALNNGTNVCSSVVPDFNTGLAQHKAKIGVDYNLVAAGTINDAVDIGHATSTGMMLFDYCTNPWYGTGPLQPNNPYYLDTAYDFKLRYCRDAEGRDPSDPTKLLPNLPAPHLERTAGSFGTASGDLLKEHVFVVGTQNGGVLAPPGNGYPAFTVMPELKPKYRLGDLVYFKLEATDLEGDSFLYVKNDEAGDPLPPSASFNERTGVFMWVVDRLPATNNRFDLTFTLNPGISNVWPYQASATINVETASSPGSVIRPTVIFSTPVEGTTITVNYGQQVTFIAQAASATTPPVKSFIWDFQDSGATSYTDVSYNDYQAQHTFVQSGTHQVTFRVQSGTDVWSNPAVVNVIVLPKKTSWLHRLGEFVYRSISSVAHAQSRATPPSNFSGETVASKSTPNTLAVQLSWKNTSIYDGIVVFRNGGQIATQPGNVTNYLNDQPGFFTPGTDFVYQVCGYIDTNRDGQMNDEEKQCADTKVTIRNLDYDVIVARVYKNLKILPIEEWYATFAPNPVGSPQRIQVDGYPAIQDGSSVYIGYAACQNQSSCNGPIYANVLLLSVNPTAKESTTKIFSQLLSTMKLNANLVGTTLGVCANDYTVDCEELHDAVCAVKNAGLCTSVKAELRRDYLRVTDLHKIAAAVYRYGASSRYCDDGTMRTACTTDNDCPLTAPNVHMQCISVYPQLTSGSYISGMSTSAWPSWDATLAAQLKSPLPKDPINKFGGNFYSTQPLKCSDGVGNEGYDPGTCWNERNRTFRCNQGSEVYMYKIQNSKDFKVYGQLEARGWPATSWQNKDVNVLFDISTICRDGVPVENICGNGLVEKYCQNLDPTLPHISCRQNSNCTNLCNKGSNHGNACTTNADCPGVGASCITSGGSCGGEVCDGGTINYCEYTLGPGSYNNEAKAGCQSDCSGWAPVYANPVTQCGGACGDGTINASEQCDTRAAFPAGWDCTIGGSPYCSPTCRIGCNAGVPYRGLCGDTTTQLPEVCDDGVSNGTLGHCNLECSGYASFCGDGVLTPTNEKDLGCACDAAVSCPANYKAVSGASCAMSCTPSGPAHQWTCVQNAEECDAINGLTSYNCPIGTSLYCDTKCNRACTSFDLNANKERTTSAVYEHYVSQGTDEGYDYTTLKKRGVPYSTKAIVWYDTNVCPSSSVVPVYRFKLGKGLGYYLRANTVAPYYAAEGDAVVAGSAFSACSGDGDPVGFLGVCSQNTALGCQSDAACGPGNKCIIGGVYVPVYEFQITKTTGSHEFYYSRSRTLRSDSDNQKYAIQNNGNPRFYVKLGPFQETCGNDVLEGTEECEPNIFQTPLPDQTNIANQYQCGGVNSTSTCRTFGGYCGDGTKQSPYEECDEGASKCVNGLGVSNNITCSTNADCTAVGFPTCGGKCTNEAKACTSDYECTYNFCNKTTNLCSVTGDACTADKDCRSNTCTVNGATCINNGGNCSYCTKTCHIGFLPRNYCGDGIQNLGIYTPTIYDANDPYTELCDDGTDNNGQPGYCNESCSGVTGSICGNGTVEAICSTDNTTACSVCKTTGVPCANNVPCVGAGNYCTRASDAQAASICPGTSPRCNGELCDDGGNNERVSYACVGGPTPNKDCVSDADCNGGTCSGIHYYCNMSCQDWTAPRCGDGVIESYCVGNSKLSCTPGPAGDSYCGSNNAGTCKGETCDSGDLNGSPGNCNTSCDNVTTAQCGDDLRQAHCAGLPSKPCQVDADCATQTPATCGLPGEEQCDPPVTQVSENCTDTSFTPNQPGVRYVGCSSTCQQLTTQCNAYGLKIWSDGTDISYINNKLAILSSTPVFSCHVDPDGVDLGLPISPTTGNVCGLMAPGTGYVESPGGPQEVKAHAVDANSIYLFGSMQTGDDWRIEKRSRLTGKLDPSFGTGGVIVGPSSTMSPGDIALSGSYLYVAGTDLSGTIERLRIEKRKLTDGVLCTGGACGAGQDFGSGGVVISTYTTKAYGRAKTIAIDTAGGYMYVGGGQGEGSTYDRFIEKRSLSTGTLVSTSTFTRTLSPSRSAAIEVRKIVLDIPRGRLYALSSDSSGGLIVEARRMTSNAQVDQWSPSFATDSNAMNTMAFDPADGITGRLYISGQGGSAGDRRCQTATQELGQQCTLDTQCAPFTCLASGINSTVIEKYEVDLSGSAPVSTLCTGGACGAGQDFGYGGAIEFWILNNAAWGLELDPTNTYLYNVGGIFPFIIQKRQATDGRLCDGTAGVCGGTQFGTLGQIAENYPGYTAYDITTDGPSNTMFVSGRGGTVAFPHDVEWVLEKRFLDTGALDTSFASTGSSNAPDQIWSTASDLRPHWNASGQNLASSWENASGTNAIAVKVWVDNPGDKRAFQAVYTSPSLNDMMMTNASNGWWACSSVYTPGWDQTECAKKCVASATGAEAGPSSCTTNSECGTGNICVSRCDPSISSNTWRFVSNYTNSTPLCDSAPYTNMVGGDAQWVWSWDCASRVAYCRLTFNLIGAPPGSSGYNPGEYCGDNVVNGPEECDRGSNNRNCSGTFVGTRCSTSCSWVDCDGSGSNPNCFLAGTQVLTPTGYTSIDYLKEGDRVISYDEKLKKDVIATVMKPIVDFKDEYITLNGTIRVTPLHRFAVATTSGGMEWKEIGKIRVGDVLIGQNQLILVRSLATTRLPSPIQVFNPALSYPHTYYVRMNMSSEESVPVLVHNIKCDPNAGCGPKEHLPW